MSYDKLKSLVANVEAIETAMKIKVQGRTATQEEKAVLSRYSGFGGIKEVLNIGTDRPIGGNMDEPVRRLQELIDAYPYFTEPMRQAVTESIKASVLTAFYTPKIIVDAVARQIHATFRQNGLQMRSFLEPSAGIGGFLPVAMPDTYDYAIEKDHISGLILSLLQDDTVTSTGGFETIGEMGFEHTKFDVIASNIPFGNFRVFDAELWKKGGAYEQATKTIHNYFFVKAMELLNEGGLLVFITSRGIADTAGNKFVREYLVNNADLISAMGIETKETYYYLKDEDKMNIIANLTAKQKAIIRRDFLISNFKNASGSNATASLLLDFAKKHMPDQLAGIQNGHNEVYEKRHLRIEEKIAVLSVQEKAKQEANATEDEEQPQAEEQVHTEEVAA